MQGVTPTRGLLPSPSPRSASRAAGRHSESRAGLNAINTPPTPQNKAAHHLFTVTGGAKCHRGPLSEEQRSGLIKACTTRTDARTNTPKTSPSVSTHSRGRTLPDMGRRREIGEARDIRDPGRRVSLSREARNRTQAAASKAAGSDVIWTSWLAVIAKDEALTDYKAQARNRVFPLAQNIQWCWCCNATNSVL